MKHSFGLYMMAFMGKGHKNTTFLKNENKR